MPGATTTVVYPKGCSFNMDYYLSTHMPLVADTWGSYGLKSWKVIKMGEDSPYSVQATLEWGSMEDFQKAASSETAAKVMGDVPNFTDGSPTLMSGDVVGTS
ncbi:uncharacterized protein LTR77_003444 [Saxophila tyrrhenica]|uniref:EthD domain-containing protein n=1 Tax=Saxophila tyrrhenica TaxID=1690608 RepID=A0AAV9PG77_9PEZI|nr:hypothetical protein LTR77_003444 [Saxophila tyrrhenica]